MRTGDTCQTISANAGIPVSLLLENNPNINSTCGNMYPGEACVLFGRKGHSKVISSCRSYALQTASSCTPSAGTLCKEKGVVKEVSCDGQFYRAVMNRLYSSAK